MSNAERLSEPQGYLNSCRMRGRVHSKQTVIYHQGASAQGFYRVNSGVVMVYRLHEDSLRQISGFYTEGEFFGLCANHEYHDTAVTVTTANVAFLTMSDVGQSSDLQEELFAATWRQLNAAQTLITTLTKKTALQKVVTFILMLIERQRLSGSEYDVRLPMSRLDIADFLGLSIETVSRQLTILKNNEIIELPSRHIVHVADPCALREIIEIS